MRYYNIEDDLKQYTDPWCYIVIGGRQTGKTYSALKYCYTNNKKFIFLKRTNNDIDLICSGANKGGLTIDISPFKPLNRDLRCNVKARKVMNGLGAFFNCDIDGEKEYPVGDPVGYIMSLNIASDIKGLGIDDAEFMIFDEFIPQPWERVNRKEGEQVLDMYVTSNRDREQRGKTELKLICLANATSISNKIFEVLEITDNVSEMCVTDKEYHYIEDRGILIHKLEDSDKFINDEENSKIFKAMENTQWHSVVVGNDFAYDDFSNVKNLSLKNYKCVVEIKYKNYHYYIYKKGMYYYMCESRGITHNYYDLSLENHQKLFYSEWIYKLKESCINDMMKFSKFTMYDLIVNYKKYFKI